MIGDVRGRSRSWTVAALAAALVLLVGIGQAQKGPKVLLVYDMEGVTGAEQSGDYNTASANYAKTRQSLADDVNAAIRGLLKAGAREVVLTDCHASGNTAQADYPLDQLPAGARHDIREAPYEPYLQAVDKSYDALVMVGMHGRSGSKGFASHTYYGLMRWNMNGLEMSETSMVALSAARFGIPLILVTGDDVHKEEVAEFSTAEYVIVKKAVSPQKAEARPRDQVSADIEAAAERALRKRKHIAPYKFAPQIVGKLKFPLSHYTAIASNYPGTVIEDDKTLKLVTPNYEDAIVIYIALSNFLRYSTADLLVKTINELSGGPEFVKQARAKLPPRDYQPTAKTVLVDNKLDRWGYQ